MSHVMLVFNAVAPVAAVWSCVGIVLHRTGHIRSRRYYGIECFVDAYFVIWSLLTVRQFYPVWGVLLSVLAAGMLVIDYRQWRAHRDDDDDDWGKRLKSWAKSHIPRPTIVQLRPLRSPS